MQRTKVALLVAAIAIITAGVFLLDYLDRLSALKHETSRWAVIEDLNGNRIAVEPSKDEVWIQIVDLHRTGARRWVGGIVERYGNKWGFRFKPETVKVAEVTAEGLQATIQMMSKDLDYWINLGYAYVGARVIEVHGG